MISFVSGLLEIDKILWSYIGAPLILIFGVYFSYKSRFMQLRKTRAITKIFLESFHEDGSDSKGVSSFVTFFTALGGCIGVENIISVCLGVQIGGPGALVWMWVAGAVGMLVRYAEIYLGITYRVIQKDNLYKGGPMYYLNAVVPSGWLSKLFCILFVMYSIEVYIFGIVGNTIVTESGISKTIVFMVLLFLILYVAQGRIERVAMVVSFLLPFFMVSFLIISFFIFFKYRANIPSVLYEIVKSAFSGHAVIGAFAGSGFLLTMSEGMKRVCYSSSIGVGIASIVHAESKEAEPQKEAVIGMVVAFLDTFVVCTLSVLVILITGIWHQSIATDVMLVVAFEKYIPYIKTIWAFFVVIIGYSSLISYYAIGKQAITYLFPKFGATIYLVYAIVVFLGSASIAHTQYLITYMSTVGGLLLIINMYGIYKLRDQISFEIKD